MYKKKASQSSHTSHGATSQAANSANQTHSAHHSAYDSPQHSSHHFNEGKEHTSHFSNWGFNALNSTHFASTSPFTGNFTHFGLSYDIFQDGEELIIEIPFPKLNPETLSITQENRLLKVSGATETQASGRTPLFIQTPFGFFEQFIQLPIAVHEDKTKALYRDGILTISLIPISSGRENKINISFS